MTLGICKFCNEEKELQRSHAIGNTIFHNILKECENGFAVKISLRENKIVNCNNSYATRQLCRNCESYFNSRFENYSVYVLREKQNGVTVTKTKSGISFQNVNQKRLILYFLSIYWRAALSDEPFYKVVKINDGVSDFLKTCFKEETYVKPNMICVKISKLIDKTNGFDEIALKQIIVNPYTKLVNKGFAYCMVYEGYFFEIFFKAVRFLERKKPGYLDPSKKILFIPYLDIFDIEKVVNALAHGMHIHKQNNITSE